MITSSSNAQVKRVIQLNKKAKERKKQQIFVAEGFKMFQEAPKEWVERVFVTEVFLNEHKELLWGIDYEVVEERIFNQMSDTQSPQGILCLIRMPTYSLEEVLAGERPLCMILEDLQDPGNVGTILRTAEGAGVTGILLSRSTVDVFNPKTIRSTMGSVYRMPFVYVDDLCDALPELKARGIMTYAAHLKGENAYDGEDYSKGTAFFVGNEGNGLSEHLSRQADRLIRIPMEGKVESLNAAIASSILMYEAYRQRRL
ncbi:MAG TPA: RNA methyltransferase [Candidatus Pelethocola excrementipullorum]|nr:RNA methyltransferase [Candidatus Pelethocola excrementipullorum]